MFLPSFDMHVRNLLHECGKVAVGLRPDDSVPVVRQNAKSTDSHPAGSQRLFDDFLEGQKIAAFVEKRSSADASIENVVD